MLPVTHAHATVSFIRLKQRSSVDLPQPDGPMKAMTSFLKTSSDTPCNASLAP
jgi:hypothetical protein